MTLIFDAIGTRWQIDINPDLADSKLKLLKKKISDRIEEFDITYSRFRNDSLIKKISLKKGRYLLPPDALTLFKLNYGLYKSTRGKFTPLIGQVLSDAGYDEHYSLMPKKLHHPPSWEESIVLDIPPPESNSPAYLIARKPVLLDFGASGKGYLIDIICELLEKNGINSYCVDAGGDIRYRNPENKILKVGLEHPENFKQVIGVARINNQSICASAGSRRKWGNYTHIIDPFDLTSPASILAVWVIAPLTDIADALATALFFVEPEVLLASYSFEYVILYKDYSAKKSAGFAGELFYQQ